MYKRSPSPETRDLVSIDTAQKHVSNDSKYIPIDFTQKPISVDTTQNPAPTNSSSLLVSQLPDLASSTQIPATHAPAKDLCSSVINQDLESSLTTRTIEKDSANRDLNLSSSQVIDKKPMSTDQVLVTLSSSQSIQNNMTMIDADLIDGTRDTNMTGVVLTDNVNEKAVPTQATKKGKQKARSAPDIKAREPRKRRSTTNVNYREQIEYDAMLVDEESVQERPAEKPAEKPAERKPTEKKPTEKKPTEKKPTEKKPTEKKPTEKKPTEKKPTEKKPAEKKPTEKKPTEKKPAEKKITKRKVIERESVGKEHTKETPAQIPEKKPKRQRVLSAKAALKKESNSGVAKVDRRKKKTCQDEDEEIVDIPKKKLTRTRRTKEAIEKDKEEKRKQGEKEKRNEEKKEKEDEEVKVNRFLQSKTSFLTEANLRELIPQWLEALPEEDRLELAPLLPELDCEVKDGQLTIKQDFGANSNHLYDAAEQWQNMLALDGFEKDDHELESHVLTDPFKDENYERNWGERIGRDQKTKMRPKNK